MKPPLNSKLRTNLQFFLKTPDADVERYLKLFTLLSRRQIREIVCAHEVRLRGFARSIVPHTN